MTSVVVCQLCSVFMEEISDFRSSDLSPFCLVFGLSFSCSLLLIFVSLPPDLRPS
jgi:hypothetical protein